MTVKVLTGHHLEFLSLKGGCTGSSESTLVKIPHYWKSHVAAQITFFIYALLSMGLQSPNLPPGGMCVGISIHTKFIQQNLQKCFKNTDLKIFYYQTKNFFADP